MKRTSSKREEEDKKVGRRHSITSQLKCWRTLRLHWIQWENLQSNFRNAKSVPFCGTYGHLCLIDRCLSLSHSHVVVDCSYLSSTQALLLHRFGISGSIDLIQKLHFKQLNQKALKYLFRNQWMTKINAAQRKFNQGECPYASLIHNSLSASLIHIFMPLQHHPHIYPYLPYLKCLTVQAERNAV